MIDQTPLTDDEIHDLLTLTLHAPLPQKTMTRVMATLAEVPGLRARGAAHGNAPTAALRRRAYLWAVTGDLSRNIYSRHRTLAGAEKARTALTEKWLQEFDASYLHPGAEPAVVPWCASKGKAK